MSELEIGNPETPGQIMDAYLLIECQQVIAAYVSPEVTFASREQTMLASLIMNAGVSLDKGAITADLEKPQHITPALLNTFLAKIARTGLEEAIQIHGPGKKARYTYFPERLGEPVNDIKPHEEAPLEETVEEEPSDDKASALVAARGANGPVITALPSFDKTNGACRGVNPDLFFLSEKIAPVEAKAVCAHCSLQQPCLEYALASKQKFGVWGGTSEMERVALRKEQRRLARENIA